jgi:hypothetical protein
MKISIGEYWAQDPKTATQLITPLQPGGPLLVECPFSGLPCSKLHSLDHAPEHPICSVRVEDGDGSDGLYSVCRDRLLPIRTNGYWPPNIQVLASVAETLFPGAYPGDVGYRRQITVQVGSGKQVVLDYVLDAPKFLTGKNRVILEVQGGGETSSTGSMTRHVAAWSLLRPPTNALLRRSVPKVGIIPNNAWKRQLEQITRKFPIAQRFGGVFALVMGELLLRYIRGLFPADCSYFPEWEIALLGVAETPSTTPGPIRIDHVQDALFLSFADFIAAVQDFPLPEAMPDPFAGTYTTMTNEDYQVVARPGSLGEAPALPMPE